MTSELRKLPTAVAMVKALAETAPNLIVERVTLLSRQVSQSLSRERSVAELTAIFGTLALALASVGLFGVMSYNVAKRTSELGLRLALGRKILQLVMTESLGPIVVGLVIGLPVVFAASRLVAGCCAAWRRPDAVTIAGAIGTLLTTACGAGFLPARRASRVDPMVALRNE